MKDYSLSVHWKQGDDLARHVEATGSLYNGLLSWANSFKEISSIVEEIAVGIKDKDIGVIADTHYIGFLPQNDDAEISLKALEARKLLHGEEIEDLDEVAEEDMDGVFGSEDLDVGSEEDMDLFLEACEKD